jgi:sugar phosphate isomerase/epimerase
MLDTCSAGNGEADSIPALLKHWMPSGLIAHIHLNDRNKRGPGQGADRFGPVLSALRATAYAGFAAVEPFDYLPDGLTSAARAIGYLRALQEPAA